MEIITAVFSSIGRDMYWTHRDNQDGSIRWTGYDDGYWWSKVAIDTKQMTKVGATSGRRYVLDPITDTVKVLPA